MMNTVFCMIIVLCISILCDCSNLAVNPNPSTLLESKKSTKLPPCKMCTMLVDSFKKGMEKTERNKHDGGDAAWEEQKLGAYKRSEIRLVEIQEALCKDLSSGEDQCHTLAENNENLLEEWWFKQQDTNSDLRQWLCVEQLGVCCSLGTFGTNCDACTNCHGNGKCKGDGTRKGNGKCSCDKGYTGEQCNECDADFYEAFRDADKLLCSQCHHACDDGGCTTAGPKGCRVCKHGWIMEPDLGGCVDVNECAKTTHGCTKNQFCVNNEGSYRCLECDKGCSGCTGDGPDECEECADGFEMVDGMCKDRTNEKRENYVTFTRYLTYLGLCIATCVILQSSPWAASAVGLAVALYITVSEYWLHSHPSPTSPNDAAANLMLQNILKG